MRFKLTRLLFALILLAASVNQVFADELPRKKIYRLWYNKPTPILPITSMDSLNRKSLVEATPLDPAWENWSLPIGNGYLGASVFGRTQTERVQITENSMGAKSLYGGVGLTAFADLFLDFNHASPKNYTRSLTLNDAMATVKYEQNGVVYQREYFASYPDKVMVIKLTASKKGKLSFTLRPEIPYQKEFGAASDYNGRKGTVLAKNDLLTLAGTLECLNIHFEGQFKVIPTGGSMKAVNDANGDHGKIVVSNADAAIIIVAVGTNYILNSKIFLEQNTTKKLEGNLYPHRKVSAIIAKAAMKTYAQLLASHQKDYISLFSRASIDFSSKEPNLTTDQLLKNYKAGMIDHYLEELHFQYGRYLLICSSRPGTLPPNLQGIWNQYDIAPWTGGYWHNINIQMNYWPAFNTNLTELFQSFADYNVAYRKAATSGATQYIKRTNPKALAEDGDNGWTIGTGASAYNISTPGMHSGPGTGTMTTMMFRDYYEFTGDKQILKNLTYPAMLGMSKFLSKVVIDTAGLLLASPSYSPEQRSQATKLHYQTVGCAFDQQMIYESHRDVLQAAKLIGDKSAILPILEAQLPKLDPVQVGWSGQIKEYREEKYYGEIVDPKHRHISQLIGMYPGTLISSNTPAWLDAAKETLNRRGDISTGWAIAFRLNLWARAKEGDRAYTLFQNLIKNRTLDNLWNKEPPFTIDGNFGGPSGVAEMLLQSHEGFIDLLPALPQQWNTGSYNGLLARGNFEISADWKNGQAEHFKVKSKIGGVCRLRYYNIDQALLRNSTGKKVEIISKKRDFIAFKTLPGEMFTVGSIPAFSKVENPANVAIKESKGEQVTLQWDKNPNAVAYNIYTHFGNSPDYKLVQAGVGSTTFEYKAPPTNELTHYILKVTAVDRSGRESTGVRVNVEYK